MYCRGSRSRSESFNLEGRRSKNHLEESVCQCLSQKRIVLRSACIYSDFHSFHRDILLWPNDSQLFPRTFHDDSKGNSVNKIVWNLYNATSCSRVLCWLLFCTKNMREYREVCAHALAAESESTRSLVEKTIASVSKE